MRTGKKNHQNLAIDINAIHGFVNRRFKEMYGKGALQIKVEIKNNMLELFIKFPLNIIEEQLLGTTKGREYIQDIRELIFSENLETNLKQISDLIKRPVTFLNIHRDIERKTQKVLLAIE